jgi:hypothetical protein
VKQSVRGLRGGQAFTLLKKASSFEIPRDGAPLSDRGLLGKTTDEKKAIAARFKTGSRRIFITDLLYSSWSSSSSNHLPPASCCRLDENPEILELGRSR